MVFAGQLRQAKAPTLVDELPPTLLFCAQTQCFRCEHDFVKGTHEHQKQNGAATLTFLLADQERPLGGDVGITNVNKYY